MAITREKKEELVAHYTDLLKQADGFVVIQYKGLTVKEVQTLRAKIRASQGDYLVTKNTLFSIALKNAGWPVPEKELNGPIAIAFGKGNFPTVVKTILDSIKDLTEKTEVKGGVMAGSLLNAKQVEAVSNLPTLPELRSQIIGLLVQPATGLVSLLNSATGQIVNVLESYTKKDEPAA